MSRTKLDVTADKMRREWDERAHENAKYYVALQDGSDQDFYASGEQNVSEQIRNDMGNICQGKNPKDMRVLEIGCGAGRITRALGNLFGEVHAVDISPQMVRLARRATSHQPHVHVYQNNGTDLSVIRTKRHQQFDFAFTYIVFQHIPSKDVIESYVREVHRLLRPGALFKFQVQGDASLQTQPDDTWLGAAYSDDEAIALAERCGFEPRHRHGAGEQYFWLWFFKKP